MHSASLAEFYYGLIRQKAFNSLSFKSKIFSVSALTLIPYVKSKIQNYHKNLVETSYSRENRKRILDKFLLKFYPYIHTLYNVLKLHFYLSYSTGGTNFISPFYKLLSINLERVNPFTNK